MGKKKYKIPIDYANGYFEGIVELTDKELEEINSGSVNCRDFCRKYLDLVVDSYRVDDYGDIGDIELEEVDYALQA